MCLSRLNEIVCGLHQLKMNLLSVVCIQCVPLSPEDPSCQLLYATPLIKSTVVPLLFYIIFKKVNIYI